MLIVARVVQGVGAALLTPQTLSTITRIFPADRRGVALSVWGATAGVATLVGPLAGGVLVDRLGWSWIFFVNVPIGVIGLALAVWLIPPLPTHPHRFDWLGVALSGVGLFLIVFGLQEAQAFDWQPWIWMSIAGGFVLMAVFAGSDGRRDGVPLVAVGGDGDSQPAGATGRGGFWGLQHNPPSGVGAGQRRHGGVDVCPHHRRTARPVGRSGSGRRQPSALPTTRAVQSNSTAGLRKPVGSSAALIERMTAISVGSRDIDR